MFLENVYQLLVCFFGYFSLLNLDFNLLIIAIGQLLCACGAWPESMLSGMPRCEGFEYSRIEKPRTTTFDRHVKRKTPLIAKLSREGLKYSPCFELFVAKSGISALNYSQTN